MAVDITTLVRTWHLEAVQVAHPERLLMFTLSGVVVGLVLKVTAMLKGSRDYS